MQVIPAIDLLGGRVVRLEQGLRERATVYHEEPAAVAAEFAAQGATRLHVVDLDGAFAGRREHRGTLSAILAAVATRMEVQIGGGIRDLEAVETLLDAGAAAVVLGTAAVRTPDLVRTACARHPGRIIVAVDARKGRVAVEGWAEETTLAPDTLARRVVEAGAAGILFTDIARDGMKTGPAVESTRALQEMLPEVPVIASGGVGSLDHILALSRAGIRACVVGRALYERAFTLPEALAAAR